MPVCSASTNMPRASTHSFLRPAARARGAAVLAVCVLASLAGCGSERGASSAPRHPSDSRAIALFAEGAGCLDRDDLDDAVDRFTKAIHQDSELAEAYYYRALAYRRLKKLDHAIDDFSAALARGLRQPLATLACLGRGACQVEQGKLQEAIDGYTEALKRDSRIYAIHYARGMARAAHGDHEAAVEDFTEVLRAAPEHAQAYNHRGASRRELGKLDLAVDDCSRAIGLVPEDADAFHNRGRTFALANKMDSALRDFDMAIRLRRQGSPTYDPALAATFYERAMVRRGTGDLKAAADDLTQAIRCDPELTDAHDARLAVLQKLRLLEDRGQTSPQGSARNERAVPADRRPPIDPGMDLDPPTAAAIVQLTERIRRHPDDASAYNDRGRAYSHAGVWKRAIDDFTRALACDPTFLEALDNRALAHRMAGQIEQAIEDYGRALRLNPDSAHALARRAELLVLAEQYERAVADYTKAIELQPDWAGPRQARGLLLLQSGDVDGAIADLDEAIRLSPRSPEALCARARARLAQGDTGKAIADFSRAIELEPRLVQAYEGRAAAYQALGDHIKAGEDRTAAKQAARRTEPAHPGTDEAPSPPE